MHVNLGNNEEIELEELWSITECIFCKKNLTEKNELYFSKLMPCLHAMCKRCFNNCSEQGELKCVGCSFIFKKDELYDNKVLYEIVSVVEIPKTRNAICSIHNICVTYWCENCEEFICEECVEQHGQLKSTRTHTIVPKAQYINKLLTGTPKPAFPCWIHPTKELTIICQTCRAMTCRDCQIENHKDHKYDFIADQVDSAKIELYDVYKHVEYASVLLNAALNKITDRETKIENLKVKMVNDINAEFVKIEEALKKRRTALISSINEKINKKLEICDANRKRLEVNVKTLKTCTKFVKCILYKSSDPVLFYTKDLLLNYMKCLNLRCRIPSAVDTVRLNFKPVNMEEIKTKIESCGSFAESFDSTTHSLNKEYWAAIVSGFCAEYSGKLKMKTGRENNDKAVCQPESLPKMVQEYLHLSKVLESDNKIDNTFAEPLLQKKLMSGGTSQTQTTLRWHTPENKQIVSTHANSDLGNNVKRVRLPGPTPVVDLTRTPALDFETLDQVLKDLIDMDQNETQPKREHDYQSPTGLQNEGWCSVCLHSGGLISCNNCPKCYHRDCHIPEISFPLRPNWTCLLCQELRPLPPGNLTYCLPGEMLIAQRLLLELYCQVEASAPFRRAYFQVNNGPKISCLLEIKANLSKGIYLSVIDFIKDVKRMFSGCYSFMKDEPKVIAQAKSLEEMFNRLVSTFTSLQLRHY